MNNQEPKAMRHPLLEALVAQQGLKMTGIWSLRDTAQLFPTRLPEKHVSVRTIQDWIRDGKLVPRDLLEAIKAVQTGEDHTVNMLGSTLALVSALTDRPLEEISIDELSVLGPALETHLRTRGYKRNSVRSYMNFWRILLRAAEKLGWVRMPPALSPEWERIIERLPKDKNYRAIAFYAASNGKEASSLTDSDLDEWLQFAISQGRTYRYASELKGCFRNRIFRLALQAYFPNLSLRPNGTYGIPLSNLPEPLRTQVSALLQWKMEPLSFGRGSNPLRAISAKHLEYFICRIAGFVFAVKNETVPPQQNLWVDSGSGSRPNVW